MSTTVPVSTASATLSRFVPAVVRGQRLLIECPMWCAIDHCKHPTGHLEDIWHGGNFAGLMVPRMEGEASLLAFARIGLDPYSSNPSRRSPFIVLDDGGDSDDMTPEQAEQFADNLEAFAAQIRAMARTARGEA
ncbi:DUF6907 domain-containing protein [Streptomyces sp. NPDC001389]|uniref:DUF6907 domain-containing protein n=1 Tax=Streptomyces sp. NPDC001389 TaxID=3364569 RepID=UPI00367FE57F